MQTAPAGNLTARKARGAVSQFSHTKRFSDDPQVHSAPGDVINTGNVSDGLGFEKTISLTA
jgi:hypothetical protein